MTRLSMTGQDITLFERNYIAKRQQGVKLRALQMDAERLDPKQNKACYLRLHHLMQIDAMDGAWDCMQRQPTCRAKAVAGRPMTKRHRKRLGDVAALTPEELAEYGHK